MLQCFFALRAFKPKKYLFLFEEQRIVFLSAEQRARVIMIKSFKHKGLKQFFEKGSTAGIKADQASKIRLRLAALNAAETVEDMNRPGYALHPLKGDKKAIWSVSVSGNWRITFEFKCGHAYVVNYEDHH